MRTFPRAVGETDQLLSAFRRRADDDENALLFVFETGLQVNAVRPDVDVTAHREIALLPCCVFVEPAVFQAADGRRRQAARILAGKGCKCLGEVAGRDALEVQDRQQRLDRLRAPHVGWQDRRREPDAAGIASGGLAIAHARLAHGDRADAGHHLALRQVTVADNTLVPVPGLEIGMLVEKASNLGFDRLREQGTGTVTQNFGELVVEGSWLDQSDDVIVGHGILLLRWRSEVVKQPHDMPPSRFPPSPTSGHSSLSAARA